MTARDCDIFSHDTPTPRLRRRYQPGYQTAISFMMPPPLPSHWPSATPLSSHAIHYWQLSLARVSPLPPPGCHAIFIDYAIAATPREGQHFALSPLSQLRLILLGCIFFIFLRLYAIDSHLFSLYFLIDAIVQRCQSGQRYLRGQPAIQPLHTSMIFNIFTPHITYYANRCHVILMSY